MTKRQDQPLRTLKMEEGGEIAARAKAAIRDRFRPAFIIMTGDSVGERVSLHGNALLGRDPSGALTLPDPGVSWQHALVEDRGDRYVLVDLGSTNGTFVNGTRVTEEVELRTGDKVKVGAMTLRFEVQDEDDQAFAQVVSQLIHIDDLTGLYMRRRFDTELAALVSTAKAERTRLGVLAMDLDGIKAINDRHGHLFGAYTIAESGKLIGTLLQGVGIACRFGGDEFVAALPGHDLTAAVRIGETIRQGVAAHAFQHEGVALRPGISVGVAAFPEHADEAVNLFRAADEALYAAKRAGKNRVEAYRKG